MADRQRFEQMDLRLPSELKYDEFYVEDKQWTGDGALAGLGAAKACFAFPTEIPFLFASNLDSPVESVTETETESDDEDYLAGLTQQMAHSFLHDDDDDNSSSDGGLERKASGLAAKEAKMVVSPQSTLCSHLTVSKNLHIAGNSLSIASSPPLFPLEKDRAAQQQVIAQESKKPTQAASVTSKNPASSVSRPALINQAQTAQPQKQQPQSVWAGQNKARRICGVGNHRTLGLPSSAWPPLKKQQQQQQPQSQPQLQPPLPPPGQQHQQSTLSPGMRAVFLNSPGTKKESTGTGVFLPRITSTRTEPQRRKSACSMVLVPARVVQALNLNIQQLGAQPRFTNGGGYAGYVLNHEALLSRSNSVASSYQKRNVHLSPQHVAGDSPDLHLLPLEWTY